MHMNDCPVVQSESGYWECPQCGWVYHGLNKPRRNCRKPPESRDPEEIAYILKTLCPECKHYHWPDKTCHCNCSKGKPVGQLIERGSCPAYRW